MVDEIWLELFPPARTTFFCEGSRNRLGDCSITGTIYLLPQKVRELLVVEAVHRLPVLTSLDDKMARTLERPRSVPRVVSGTRTARQTADRGRDHWPDPKWEPHAFAAS